jgi:hypothetical protein
VLHLEVDDDGVDRAVRAFGEVIGAAAPGA